MQDRLVSSLRFVLPRVKWRPGQGVFRRNIALIGLLALIRTEIRHILLSLRIFYLNHIWGTDIHPTVILSLKAKIDKTFPKGIHIGEGSAVSFGTAILSHDFSRDLFLHTRIGKNTFIGAMCIILPGITIGDQCIVGAGTVVTKDVPSGSLIVGNPGRIKRSGISTTGGGALVRDAAQRDFIPGARDYSAEAPLYPIDPTPVEVPLNAA